MDHRNDIVNDKTYSNTTHQPIDRPYCQPLHVATSTRWVLIRARCGRTCSRTCRESSSKARGEDGNSMYKDMD